MAVRYTWLRAVSTLGDYRGAGSSMSMACQDVRVLSQMICESSFWARLPLSVETFSDRPDAVTVITPLPLWCLRVRAGFLPGHTDPMVWDHNLLRHHPDVHRPGSPRPCTTSVVRPAPVRSLPAPSSPISNRLGHIASRRLCWYLLH